MKLLLLLFVAFNAGSALTDSLLNEEESILSIMLQTNVIRC